MIDVSSGNTVSTGDIVSALTISSGDTGNETYTEVQTIWEKPITEYTPTEGLLLILVLLAIFFFLQNMIGGLTKWQR